MMMDLTSAFDDENADEEMLELDFNEMPKIGLADVIGRAGTRIVSSGRMPPDILRRASATSLSNNSVPSLTISVGMVPNK